MLAGDQTTDFHVGRRIKCTVTAGAVYVTIAAVAFTSLTTITVDPGSLDSGLSAVSLGIASAANTSVPLPDTAILAWNGPLAPMRASSSPARARPLTITSDKLVVANTNGRKAVLSSVNVTVNLASADANGLDTGAETWYHLWIVWNGATVAGLASLSATAPALPSGYTHKAYVGADYNNSSSNLIDIYQRGGIVRRAALSLLSLGSATSLTQVTITTAVPPNAIAIDMRGHAQEATAFASSTIATIAPSNAASFEADIFWAQGPAADVKGSGALGRMLFLSSSQALWYRVSAAAVDLDLDAIGWEY